VIERSHLSILDQIDKQGSLTKAAEALHLTQSALSHKIGKLQQQIGAALWVKEGRQLKLTPAGNYLLKEAKRLLPQLERLDRRLLEHARGELGRLNIGMECHPCYQWLLGVIDPFMQQWPGLEVDVKQRFQFGGMAALFNHEIDMLVTPDPVRATGVSFEPVFAYEQVLIVSNQNSLATKAFIAPEDMRDQVLYSYPVASERLDIFAEFLTPAKRQPKSHKTLEATEMILHMVASNRGVATLPKWLAARYIQSLPICALSLGSAGIHKQIHLGVRSTERELPHLNRFIEVAKSQDTGSLRVD